MNEKPLLQQFRDAVYQRMSQRADATFDWIDALTVAGHVESPVALSEEVPFRRHFSSVYDAMENGQAEASALRQLLYEWQPAQSETIAGYEVYATGVTPNERPAAETLPERLLWAITCWWCWDSQARSAGGWRRSGCRSCLPGVGRW